MRFKLHRLEKMSVKIAVIFVTLMGLIAIGTVAYRWLEGWSWVSSFYFTVCTLTTVGYGDLVPTTDLSRMFTAIYALAGVSLALASLGLLGTAYITSGQERLMRSRAARRTVTDIKESPKE